MSFNRIDAREQRAIRRACLRFLPLLIVLIILSSILISYIHFDNTKRDIIDQQQEEIVSAMIDYRNYISYMTSIVRTIEADYIELVANESSSEAVEALFTHNMREYPIIGQMRMLAPDGMETLRVERINNLPYVFSESELESRSDRYYYQETTLLGKHQFLFSVLNLYFDQGAIQMDPVTGQAKPVLRISSPIESGTQRIGYFVITFLMRDYLNQIRTSLGCDGCHVLMLDENGYLFNDANDENNFGFCYNESCTQHYQTIHYLFPNLDLTADSGSLIADNMICSYTAFTNIYDRSKDYFVSKAATDRLIFLVYYDQHSLYAKDLTFSYLHQLLASWRAQLITWFGLSLLYFLSLYLVFIYDRIRFTNLFSDNRYTKAALKQAILHHQFVNYYQPIVNIQDGSVLGFEALSRWKTHGRLLPPGMFMDEILHYQLGQMLDENVFRTMRKDRLLMEKYPEFADTFISINCCQQTFNSLTKDPPGTIIRLTEAEKKYIVLELVENIIFNQNTKDRIRDMYKHNILFAIDDFGTGNSNVAFIRSLENLKVKIDRAFVPVNTNNQKERVIIESFVKMFVDQGLRLIVEGVETQEQYRYLKQLGISGVQGFYFSKPMTLEDLIKFMQKKEYLHKL